MWRHDSETRPHTGVGGRAVHCRLGGARRCALPRALALQLQNQAPACRLLADSTLPSHQGNADVAWRLYRWVSTLEEPFETVYDTPPYNQVGVTLWIAGQSESTAFWASHQWLGLGWFEAPHMVVNRRYGEMLIVPGRITGTGSGIDDHVFMPTAGRGWTEINATQLDQESAEGWARQLAAHLPEGANLAKGIRLDYATLSGESGVWREGDANCCPSGGKIRFTLRIGEGLVFEVEEAHYLPPGNGAE